MLGVNQVYEFDEFRVDGTQRRLMRSGKVVPLHSKAFDLLLVLVRSAGRDLTKDELLNAVWPGQILEESNLAVNISAIRRALGETAAEARFVVTIPGHGYRFVANVREARDQLVGVLIERETIAQLSIEEETDSAQNRAVPLAGTTLPANRNSVSRTDVFVPQQPSAATHTSRFSKFQLVLLSLGALGFVAVTVAGFSWWRHAGARSPTRRFDQISYKQLTNNGIVYDATLSPDGKFFAFVMVQKEKESLRAGQTNNTDQIELLPPAEVSYDGLTFSHDGSSVFYAFADQDGVKFSLYRMAVLGGVPVKLRDNMSSVFALSRDDQWLAFVREDAHKGTESVVISDLAGSHESTIVTLPTARGVSRRSLSWSPDNSLLSFAANDGVSDAHYNFYVIRVATGETKTLAAPGWRGIDSAVWFKDGSGLAVLAQGANPKDTTQLWFVSYPNGEASRITNDLATYNVGLSMSDDGRNLMLVRLEQFNHIWVMPTDDPAKARQITFGTIGSEDGLLGLDWTPTNGLVYASSVGQGQSIWMIDPDGRNPKQITAPEYDDTMPSVTADGRTIVFESNRSGRSEIWRADIDGANARQLTTCGRNYQPSISPDGKWVVYKSNCDGLGSLWRTPLDGGQPQRLSETAAAWPEVSPDGKWVACAINVTPDKTELAIIPFAGGQPAKFLNGAPLANINLGLRWTVDGKAIIYRDQRIGLWRQAIEGGAPTRIQGLPSEKIYGFRPSRDGKLFAYTLGAEIRDVVLINSAN